MAKASTFPLQSNTTQPPLPSIPTFPRGFQGSTSPMAHACSVVTRATASQVPPFPSELIIKDCEPNVLTRYLLCTISSYSYSLIASSFDLTNLSDMLESPVQAIWVKARLGTTPAVYPGGSTMENAFICTLTAGGALGSESDFWAYWLRIFEAAFDPDNYSGADHRLHRSLLSNGRKLIFTDRGYMGLGPGARQLGDRVVVLFGADVSMVVRRREDGQFAVIGESYLYGIMAGHVVRTWRGSFPSEVGQSCVLNDNNFSQFKSADPLNLKFEDIEIR
ncbi:hypothetical protein PAXRUDRAFT_13361 [Paxillus rubicundulus Ve08.2h10]|uniref:Uncharacterized protein n=1 Tax=Paxillus rubicundulus Ve08.2h10 TaxID=930991 RepID=A0A0D0DTV3_9AGAM|nr:hypothetical protein PAXRUDRAFT_13361 [Paxillus rubicundulus Ve08.2h10]